MKQLFGPEDAEAEKKHSKAELKFHHAFFPLKSVGKALIAPRDPKSGTVNHSGPITYEVVNAENCCKVMIDYLPRKFDPEQAEKVLLNLYHLYEHDIFKTRGAAIGGKSGIWGRIQATDCWVEPGPEVPRNEATAPILNRKAAPCR